MSREEQEQLFKENQALAYFAIKKYFPTFTLDEDCQQEALIGLWKACSTYSPGKSQFSTYATTCILNSIRMWMRKRENDPLENCYSIHSNVPNTEDLTFADFIEDLTADVEGSGIFLKDCLRKLSPKEKLVVDCKLEGLTQEEAAERMGFSQSYYCRMLKNIREKLTNMEE